MRFLKVWINDDKNNNKQMQKVGINNKDNNEILKVGLIIIIVMRFLKVWINNDKNNNKQTQKVGINNKDNNQILKVELIIIIVMRFLKVELVIITIGF